MKKPEKHVINPSWKVSSRLSLALYGES